MDWLAAILELSGLYAVGNKSRWGFVLAACGCTVWVWVALATGVHGLLLVVIPALALNCRNFWRWGRPCATGPQYVRPRI